MANFNIPPYFDDYDPDKGYHKILFRPSVAVQARELNQMQSILQKQIERFGSHVFKEGTIVLGGGFDIELDVPYIKASSVEFPNKKLDDFVGQIFEGQTSGLRAYVKAVEYDEDDSTYVFMIRYTRGSETSNVFLENEIVSLVGSETLNFTVAPTSASGFGSVFSIEEGVIFSKGMFVAFSKDSIILDKYSTTPSVTIGLETSENFVTDLTDVTLLDNALGSPNENAPGAHRYAIETGLSKIVLDGDFDEETFIPLFSMDNGAITLRKERTEYSIIYDELAKRTYDESGDYYVKGFDLRTREYLDTGENEGLLTTAQGGNSEFLSVDVLPGLAFVKGYEINKLTTTHVIVPKSTNFKYVDNQLVNARSGGYFFIKEIVGSLQHDKAITVDLYDAAETRVTNDVKGSVSPTGNKIGTAKLKSLVYQSGTLGQPSAQMRAYLFDHKMNAGRTLSEAKSIAYTTSPNYFFADIVLSDGKAVIKETNTNTLLFPIGKDYVRTVRSNTGAVGTTFSFNRSETLSANLDAAESLSTTVSTSGESLSYSSGNLSAAEKRELIVSASQDVDFVLEGTVAVDNGNNIVTGTATNFDKLIPGTRLVFEGSGSQYYINAVTNSTSLTLKSNLAESTLTGNTFSKAIRTGDILDLTANGSSGVTRTANVSSGSLIIDLKEYSTGTIGSIDTQVTYRVIRNVAAEVKKKLRSARYVKINTSNNVANSVGPYNLGIPDVFNVVSVRMDTSDFTTASQGTDVTSSFNYNNGQKNNFYDHGSIIHTGSLDLTNKHLLVELEHFEPDFSSGYGYFSVDSYPVDDTASSNTTIFTYEIPKYGNYDLRNVLDYRPYKSNTAVSSVTVGSATVNPAITDNFRTDTNGLRIASIDSDINVDYSYYLARRDLITINREGLISSITGTPAEDPVSPVKTGNSMTLSKVYIPPYPSISETLARNIGQTGASVITEKVAPKRFTMKEIGVINQKVNNLEYYNALNLLEKSALDLKIIDENGLDRFKNGFFVDNFSSHALGDTDNIDYRISVDTEEGSIRPFFETEAFKYELDEETSSNYQVTGDIITLPYSEKKLMEIKNVTTTRNIEKSSYRFVGVTKLEPSTDNWVDTSTVDKVIDISDPSKTLGSTSSTVWDSWRKNVTGYTVIVTSANGNRNVYNVATRAQANKYFKPKTVWSSGAKQTYELRENYYNDRSGTKTTITNTKVSEELGEFVTDVDIKTYIRPQTIKILAEHLKPNTRFYVFFDNEDMNEYTTPVDYENSGPGGAGVDPVICVYPPIRLYEGTYNLQSQRPLNPYVIDPVRPGTLNEIIDPSTILLKSEGSELRSDENGTLVAYLRLPETGKRFRTGTKEIVITDSPTNSTDDSSSYSVSYFVANGLTAPKQNTILSTTIAIVQDKPLYQKNYGVSRSFGSDTVRRRIVYPPPRSTSAEDRRLSPAEQRRANAPDRWPESCLAYSFKIEAPAGEDGIFLTSTDIWLQAKDPTLGIWFEIRTMDSSGQISGTQVPGSEVWYKSEDVPLWDGDLNTEEDNKFRVTFPSPVFLMNDQEYAFLIHTEGVNPNYYSWIARLGETDIITGKQYTTRKLNGNLFTTNNNRNWDMVPDVDLKVVFNRASFTVGEANVNIGNSRVEMLNLSDSANTFQSGELVKTDEFLSLSEVTFGSNNIVVGDIITGTTSGVTANVTQIISSKYYTDNVGFELNETYTISDSGSTDKSITGSINLIEYGIGVVRKYDSTNNFMIIDHTNGLFKPNTVIRGISSNNTNTIASYDTYKYSVQNLNAYHLTFEKTFALFGSKVLYTSNTFSDYSSIIPNENYNYRKECELLSYSDELSRFGSSNNYSLNTNVILITESEYVSPVLNINRSQGVFVHNLLNNDFTGETEPSGGSLLNRYISLPVTLADGQDAEDLYVSYSGYKPVNSDVKVWGRFRTEEDNELLDLQNWIELTPRSNVYSSTANDYDFIEYVCDIPDEYKNSNGVFQYVRNATPIVANTTGFDVVNNAIFITDANTIFTANQQVYYMVPDGGTPLTPLEANTAYYVDTVNSTAVTLKASYVGSTIDITDFRTDAEPEAHTLGGEVYNGFKQFQVKIGLAGTDSAIPPRVADLRVIALQV